MAFSTPPSEPDQKKTKVEDENRLSSSSESIKDADLLEVSRTQESFNSEPGYEEDYGIEDIGLSEDDLVAKCTKMKENLKSSKDDFDIKEILEEIINIKDQIDLDILLKSGIGKEVHKLLNSKDLEVKEMSKQLVDCWKKVVDEHENVRCTTPVTPRPNYEMMLSPDLRKELRKYGLKVIPRRKALPLLDHIYKETHPSQNVETSNSLDASFSSQEDMPEESINPGPDVNDILTQSQTEVTNESLAAQVIKFIQSDPELTRQCLTYEPIWFEDFCDRFKSFAGIKRCKADSIKDVLDNECITFRTAAQGSRNSRRR